jgi:hypothetical protein
VDKDADAVSRKNDVGIAWKIPTVQPEPVAHGMQ